MYVDLESAVEAQGEDNERVQQGEPQNGIVGKAMKGRR